MHLGKLVNAEGADFLLALRGPGNIVGGLHSHKRVHLHAKSLFNAKRHVPGKVGAAVQQAAQRSAGNVKRDGGGHSKAGGLDDLRLDDLRLDEIPGMRRIIHGHYHSLTLVEAH